MRYSPQFTNNSCGLAYYLHEVVFPQWEEDRKPLEEKWQRNLDAYNCVSSEFWKAEEAEDWRSDTFIGVTKQKIIAAYSLFIDVVLQGNQLPFNLAPSPWSGVVLDALSDEEQKAVENIIENHKDLIIQQMKDCQADRQLMKCALSAAIYGETFSKRFVHQVDRTVYQAVQGMNVQGVNGRMQMTTQSHLSPAWRYVSVWNMFRDPETNDLQKSMGLFEREFTSLYTLRQKLDRPYYINDYIQTAISEADKHWDSTSHNRQGESTGSLPPYLRDVKNPRLGIRNVEFWGRVPTLLAEEFEYDIEKGKQSFATNNPEAMIADGDEVEVLVEMANDQIIRYLRINEDETRPYYRAVWEEKLDHLEATGVADNLESTQVVINGMVRAYEDNLKLSGNVILAIKEEFIRQWDKVIKPGLKLSIAEEVEDVRQAVQQVVIQNVGAVLLEGLALFERYADEACLLPKILQGAVQEKQKADTAFEMNLLQANSGKYMGGVIRNFDEGLIEPIITDFYHFNMLDQESGIEPADLTVEALGFTSFQDQVVRLQKLMQLINLVLSNDALAGEVRFRELLEACGKSLDLDPDQFLKPSEDRTQEEQAASQQAQEQYRLEVQKVMAEIDKFAAEAQSARTKSSTEEEKVKIERFKAVEELKIKQQEADAKTKAAETANKPVANKSDGTKAKPKKRAGKK